MLRLILSLFILILIMETAASQDDPQPSKPKRQMASRAEFIKYKLQAQSRLYITSGGKEYASDSRPDSYSPLSKQILEALRGYGGNDGLLTWTEIIAYLEVMTEPPVVGRFGSYEERGDFLFEVAAGERNRHDYAFLIGNDTFDEWDKLNNPLHDLAAISEELSNEYAFEVDELINATKSTMEQHLVALNDRSYGEDDQLLIYISSHGLFDARTRKSYLVAKDSKISDPTGSSFLSYANLIELVDKIPCRHILIILDSVAGAEFRK